VFLLLLGLMSSLTNIGILLLINTAIGGKSLPLFGDYNYIAFIALIFISFLSTQYFQHYMVDLTNNIMYGLELTIVQKVRNSLFESFEKLGPERIYAAIGDTRVLSRVPEIFVTLINSTITLICSLAYLFWVSPMGGATVLVMMIALLLLYLYRNKKIQRDMNLVRDLQDSYYSYLRELLGAFRQIRISPIRSNTLFNNFILENRNKSKVLSIRASRKYVLNELIGVYSWYIVLGGIIFVLPWAFQVDKTQIAAFITTVLFMMSPVAQLIMMFPLYTAFKISVERIDSIDKALDVDALPVASTATPVAHFKTLRFEQVVYKYTAENATTFTLEVADFTLTNEEILFIIGGNGSGKTTFINVLTGLCKPVSGKIYIDEKEVNWEQFSNFCNSMAVVYTNQHLFRENYDGFDLSENNSKLSYFENMVNLDGVLKIDQEHARIDTKVSKGQQKRLSLLLALLENKPIIILDEWAAEQDPQNRKLFYTRWLQEMKSMGKTVIAVTHDDDFYHVADRVMKFNFGHISQITTQPHETIETIKQ
jgi:ABC-type siderophore export system fused ATPase/permease subunit